MNTNKPYVFISYAHRDSKKVFTIIEWLENSGYEIWYDNGIDPGTEWDTTIAERVKNSTIMLAFISKNYLNSDNCKDELNFARNKQIDRILIYLEDVQLPDAMEMRLSRHQAIHFYKYINQNEFYEKLCASEKVANCKKIISEQNSLVSDEGNNSFQEKLHNHMKFNQQRIDDCYSRIEITEEDIKDGEILLLTFKVNSNADIGSCPITLKYFDDDIIDNNLTGVYPYVKNGEIIISK